MPQQKTETWKIAVIVFILVASMFYINMPPEERLAPTNGSGSPLGDASSSLPDPPVPSPQPLFSDGLPYADREYLYDASGNRLFLKSINCHRNERRFGDTFSSYWTIDDIEKLKESGGNCIEIHSELPFYMMPDKSQIDESYFTNTLDVEVDWCEQHEIYYIINLQGFRTTEAYMREKYFLPSWLFEGIFSYSYPLSQSQANEVVISFLNTDSTRSDPAREAWLDLWKFIAERYKDNRYFMMGLMNEPGVHISYPDTATREKIGRTYYTLMARTVDAIRSAGANQVIFIDHVRCGSYSYHVNDYRPNTVMEAHCYISSGSTISAFKASVDNYVSHYRVGFNMPLYFGEYGFYSPSKPSGWESLLQQEVSYMDSKPIIGRAWHCWSDLYGEYWGHYTASESERLLDIILG